jgi:hypothetical protein
MASGLKVRVVISHAAGVQVLTVTCSIPALAKTVAAAGSAAVVIATVKGLAMLPPLWMEFQPSQPT